MEEPKDGGNHFKLEQEEADKQYRLMTIDRSRIEKQIEQRKKDEYEIQKKLIWFSECESAIDWREKEIKHLEDDILGKVEPCLPMNSVPRTTGFVSLTDQNDGQWDRKRCQKRLIKKDRMDMDYLEQLQEELLSSRKSTRLKSTGVQELNHLIGSMEHGIRHGNTNRAEEMKMYREIRNVKETREVYNAPEPDPPYYCYTPKRWLWQDKYSNRRMQHKIKHLLDEIEEIKMDLKVRKHRVTRLKSDLEFVRKNIRCLEKELQDVTSKRPKANEHAYEPGEHKKESTLPDRKWMYIMNNSRGSLSRDYVRSMDAKKGELDRELRQSQMEEHLALPKDRSGKNLVKSRPSYKLEKREADEQYRLLTHARSQIQKQIEQRKADENQINRELKWFSECDENIYRCKNEIKHLEASIGKVEPSLPTNSVPRTTGFICLTDQNDGQWDRNLCLKRLIKKDRIEMDYLEEVHEELLSSMKSTSTRTASCDTQELNHLIRSMEHGIRHGKKNRVDEMKMIREIRNMKEISKAYNAPKREPDPPSYQYARERLSKRDIDLNHLTQRQLNLRLDEVEKMESDLTGRKRRVARLKAELEFVRKNISCLQKELQDVSSKRLLYKRAYDLGERKKERVFTKMEEPKDGSRSRFYLVKFRPSYKLEKQEADKQYQLLTLARSRIEKQIEQRKADEHKIQNKLRWFSECDAHIDWRKREIKHLEAFLGKVEPRSPTNPVPRTTGFVRLTDQSNGRWDQNRYQKRLIKKDRTDYLERLQEELLSSKYGAQELNHLNGSMEHGIRHGNKNRADEMKMYCEIRKVKETKELYNAPEPNPASYWYKRETLSKSDIDSNRAMQHKINLRLDEIDIIEGYLKGREPRVKRLKSELEFVRRSISCLEKELQDVTSKRLKAHKRANELGGQKKELKSYYREYQLLIINAKRLSRKKDAVRLKQACDTQVVGFMRQWNDSQAFRMTTSEESCCPRFRRCWLNMF
ncbi:hypothetical protein OSB04_014284, partial [Centaurea solstitialis]